MSKEIEDSPNSVEDGQNDQNENDTSKGMDSSGDNQREGEDDKGETGGGGGSGGDNAGQDGNKEEKDNKSKGNKGERDNKEGNSYITGGGGEQHSKNRPKDTPDGMQKKIEEIFEKKQKEKEDFKTQKRQEYLKKYILEVIKKIAAEHNGIEKMDGSESYDKKQMLQHMLKKQHYKLLGDKYDLRDARYVQFFIDTSGVYRSANRILNTLIPEVIQLLEKQGYECYIAACGNGFYGKDIEEDPVYHTRKTLEEYRAGKVNKIACPTPETAAKMADEAEFSVILADFDGLSSICRMANLCQKDKVPYFLSTEDRYPWEDPTLHDWVDPELCEYDKKLIYDVSIDGNPTLEQYNKWQDEAEYEQDYEYDNGYDDYEH